jgi:hypothetical protein
VVLNDAIQIHRLWRTSTYADVHRLILEILHLRLTLCEASDLADEAARMIAYPSRLTPRSTAPRVGC